MDKFEQFFKENRMGLDAENSNPEAWKNIEASMKTYKKRQLLNKLYIAAGVLIIISVGVFALTISSGSAQRIENQSIFKNVSTDLEQQELNYINSINEQIEIIKQIKIAKEHAQMFGEFVKQLKIIDNQYDKYKKEIQSKGYNEELIQQIIYNYQLKLSVLQMLQSEMEKINNLTKNRKDESIKEKITLEI